MNDEIRRIIREEEEMRRMLEEQNPELKERRLREEFEASQQEILDRIAILAPPRTEEEMRRDEEEMRLRWDEDERNKKLLSKINKSIGRDLKRDEYLIKYGTRFPRRTFNNDYVPKRFWGNSTKRVFIDPENNLFRGWHQYEPMFYDLLTEFNYAGINKMPSYNPIAKDFIRRYRNKITEVYRTFGKEKLDYEPALLD